MGLSLLLAVDEDRDALAAVKSQLVRRYARDYRVECLADPAQALRLLTELAHAGEEVALVLARNPPARTTGIALLDHARQLHPHAKRALLVPSDTWSDETTAEAIRVSLALGRIDYYVPSPAASLDEEFHGLIPSRLKEREQARLADEIVAGLLRGFHAVHVDEERDRELFESSQADPSNPTLVVLAADGLEL